MGNDLTSPNGHNPKTAAAAHGQVTSMGTAQKQWQYCPTVECTARRSRNCMAVSCQAFLFVSCGVVILHLFPRAHHGAKPFLAFFSNTRRSVEETKEGCFCFSGRAPMRKGSIELPFTPPPYANDAMADFMRTLADNKSLFNSHLRRQQSPWHDSGRSVRSSGFARVLRFNYTQLLTLADWLSLRHGRRF